MGWGKGRPWSSRSKDIVKEILDLSPIGFLLDRGSDRVPGKLEGTRSGRRESDDRFAPQLRFMDLSRREAAGLSQRDRLLLNLQGAPGSSELYDEGGTRSAIEYRRGGTAAERLYP